MTFDFLTQNKWVSKTHCGTLFYVKFDDALFFSNSGEIYVYIFPFLFCFFSWLPFFFDGEIKLYIKPYTHVTAVGVGN